MNISDPTQILDSTVYEQDKKKPRRLATGQLGQDCVSYSSFAATFILLTLFYSIVLVACVFFLNKREEKSYRPCTPPHLVYTPSRSLYQDDQSARKRTPNADNRYLY